MEVFHIQNFPSDISSHGTPLMVFDVGTINLLNHEKSRLATKRFHKITK